MGVILFVVILAFVLIDCVHSLPFYKVVKFSNGKYGLRKGLFFKRFKDLKDTSARKFYWTKSSVFFKDCQVDDIEDILTILRKKYPKKNKDIKIVETYSVRSLLK